MRGLVEIQKAAGIIALGLIDSQPLDSDSTKGEKSEGKSGLLKESISLKETAQAQTDRQLSQLRTFWNISQAISLETDLNPLFEMIHHQLENAMGNLNSFTIALYDLGENDQLDGTIRIPYSVEDGRKLRYEPFPLGEGLTSIVIRTRKSLLISKNVEEQLRQLDVKMADMPSKSWLGAPMIYAGDMIGVIVVQDVTRDDRFNEEDERMLTALAAQAAVVVRNASLLEAARRQARQEKLTNEITARVRRASDIQTILMTTARELGAALGVRSAHIHLNPEFSEPPTGMGAEP